MGTGKRLHSEVGGSVRLYVSVCVRKGFLGKRSPKQAPSSSPARSSLLPLPSTSAGVSAAVWGCWKSGYAAWYIGKLHPGWLKPHSCPSSPACGTRLDRNFEHRGLGAGWRARFLLLEKILRFQYCSLFRFFGTNAGAFRKSPRKLRRERAPALKKG